MTQAFVDELVQVFPSIHEIWLFGSRANGRARLDSDWDYLIFSPDSRFLNRMCQERRFNRADIDALVVWGEFAIRPWPMADGWQKKLRMVDDLQWTPGPDGFATYRATKDRSPGSFAVDTHILKARRVHPQ